MHNEVRIDRRNADIRMVQASVQRMVDVLWDLNAFPGAAPNFILEDGAGLEVERAARDVSMVTAGVIEVTEQYVKRTYDFEDGDFIIPAKPVPPAGGLPALNAPPVKASIFSANGPRFTPKQQAVEDALALVIADLPQAIPSEQVFAAIRAADSPHDLVDKLAVLLRDADPHEFTATLEKALYAADLLGYIHAKG